MPRRGAHRAHNVRALVADPDTATLGRLGALRGAIGRTLNGEAGPSSGLRGVDRGDPVVTLTGPVPASPSPTNAIAAVTAGTGAGYKPTMTVQDTAMTDPNLDPYNGLLLARMRDLSR